MIILILDGCNVKALQKAKTPCIEGLMEEGTYTFKCKSVYPTATYTAHSSIMTGTYPDVHGIVGNSFYDRSKGKIIDFDVEDVNKYILSKTLLENVQGTKVIVGEPVTRKSKVVITKAKVQSRELFEQDVYALSEAIKLIKQYNPLVTIINLPGVDGISELYGPLSGEILTHLKILDEIIGDLKETIEKIYDDYLLIILADHGMTSVKENIDLNEVLEGLNVITCISHRAAHIYTVNEDVKEVVRRVEDDGRFEKIILGDELANYHLKTYRSGDLVVIAKDGYELSSKQLRGSHGGISPDEVLVPLIVNKPEYVDLLKNVDITVVPKIVFRYFREVNAISIVKKRLKLSDPAHEWSHTLRVLKIATKLAIKYDADIEAVRISCLFHDVGKGLKGKKHEVEAASLAEDYLKSRRSPKPLIDKVKRIILSHHADPDKLETIEEKILWDADKLDALGLIGLARCFMEEGFFKRTINDAINHALKDLKEFKDKMHFYETKEIAKTRASNTLKFIEKLKEELIEV